jgi:hypothetical protein
MDAYTQSLHEIKENTLFFATLVAFELTSACSRSALPGKVAIRIAAVIV